MTTTYKLSTTQTTYVGAAGGDIFDTTANTLLPADVIAGGNGSNALDLQGGGVFNLQAVWKLQGIQFLVAQEGQAAYTVPGTGSTIPATGQTVYLRNGLNLEVDVSNAVLTPGNPTAPGIVIHGASDADLIRLGSGDDTVFVGSANEVIAGGSGAASIYVSAATIGATIDGGTGTATLLVTGGGTLSMGSNLTRISQVSLRDAAPGTTQPNYFFTANALRGLVIAASSGNDTISVGDASQQVIAGAGNDTVLASAATAGALVTGNGTTILRIGGGGTATLNAATGGVNVVLGQATNLTLSAMSGVTATGSAGADTITALASGQTLISQSGQDQLVGAQTGGDTFQGTASGLNGDTLQNFAASGDVIDITDLVDGTGTHLSYVGNATGGVLTATDGTRTARINLTGVFAASGFLPGSDGANGTRLTYTAPSLPLTLAAALSDDTGTSASDGITSDPAVAGTVTSAFGLASFTASLDGGTAASILTGLGSGGAFTVSTAQEQALAGGTIADGRHTLLLTATDIAGDTITDTVPFTLATAAPALSAALADDTGAPANPTLTSDDTITGSLTDPVGIASFIESVDGGPAQSVFGQLSGSGFTLSPAFLGLADGAHTVALTATDIAGNASTVDVGFTLVPTLSITARLADDTGISASDGITSDPAIDGNVSATDAIVALTGSLDGGPADSLLSVLGPNGDFGISAALMQSVAGGTLTDGAHTLLLSATDAGGDTATDSVGFTLETAPPTLTAALADPTGAPSIPRSPATIPSPARSPTRSVSWP